MRPPTVHWPTKHLTPWSPCGAPTGAKITTDPREVTCKRCLAYLAKNPIPKQ